MKDRPKYTLDQGIKAARDFVETLVSGTAVDHETFDATALSGLTVVDVSEGRILCEIEVLPRIQNRYGTLHGGCTAMLVDVVTTAAMLTQHPSSGVSVHIACTYLSPMPGGEVVQVEAFTTKVGGILASMTCELRRKSTGKLVATGTQTKSLYVPSKPKPVQQQQQQQQQHEQQRLQHSKL